VLTPGVSFSWPTPTASFRSCLKRDGRLLDRKEERQLLTLRALGCDRAQGYFIARPMDAGEFLDWIRMRRQNTA